MGVNHNAACAKQKSVGKPQNASSGVQFCKAKGEGKSCCRMARGHAVPCKAEAGQGIKSVNPVPKPQNRSCPPYDWLDDIDDDSGKGDGHEKEKGAYADIAEKAAIGGRDISAARQEGTENCRNAKGP